MSILSDDVMGEIENQLVENTVVNLTDHSIFRMGECFNSYEELLKRLGYHSKQSLVHYWRRDSRTVQGAYMKTARPIEPKLKYYSVKYACVYGGQKFFPRGKGQRHSITMRTNCPSHIMVRANKSGQQLEVISVCNSHNHPVSKELYRRLPQDRRLSPTVKQEVLDLLRLGVERKRVREYIRMVTGKLLTNKDLLNLGASDRKPRDAPRPARAQALMKALQKLDLKGDLYKKEALSNIDLDHSESMDSEESLCDEDNVNQVDSTTNDNNISQAWEIPITDDGNTLDDRTDMQQDTQDILSEGVIDGNLTCPLYDSACDPIGQEVEIFYEEEPNETKNIIEYFYPGSVAVMSEDSVHENDIVIENVDLTSQLHSGRLTGQTIEENNTHQTDNNFTNRLLSQSSAGKVKLKLVDLKSLFSTENEARILIQQNPDRNENTLFSSFEDASGDVVTDSELSLKDVLVIQNPTSNGSICNVPIQMLALSPGGSISLKENSIDNHGIITFASEEHEQFDGGMGNDGNSVCIQDVDSRMCASVNPFDESMTCQACGRTNKESELYVNQLKEERTQLLKEVTMLKMTRDKLRNEIKGKDTNVEDMWEEVKNDGNKSGRLSRTWESLSDVENDDDSEKIQYTFEP